MTIWDPSLYLKFGGERTRPASDLLARIALRGPALIYDLGCGPGNSTALLRQRFPDAEIAGVDSSDDMLAQARASGVQARWIKDDFNSWAPEQAPDLIYANAAFQWADDPLALVVRLYESLGDAGVLAFQVPQNFDQPSHTEIRAAIETGPWRAALASARQYDPGFAKGADYARALMARGATVDVWTSEYLHVLEGEDPVFTWMSGTGLRPFIEKLDGEMRAGFADEARARLARAYPREADGRTLFPFRRLFVVAARTD